MDAYIRSKISSAILSHPEEWLIGLVFDACKKHGVRAWLDQGTLLGLSRDGALIPWDGDIDICVWYDEVRGILPALYLYFLHCNDLQDVKLTDRCMILYPENEACRRLEIAWYRVEGGYAVKLLDIPPEMQTSPVWWCRPQHIAGRLLYRLSIETVGWMSRKQSASIHFINYLLPTILTMMRFSTRLKRSRISFRSPCCFFDSLEIIRVGHIDIMVPCDVSKYLAHKYGANWREPKEVWDYSADDGALKAIGRI